jgi:serine/threonine-protein kinase RsbW
MFAKVVEFHFSRVGWRVVTVSTAAECLDRVRAGGTNLVIVDHALEGAEGLLEGLKVGRDTSRVPVIALFPSDRDPARARGFQVMADESLVEPFEVFKLLMVAETELARSGEEELLFDQQATLQLGTTRANVERAIEVGSQLIAASGMSEESQELVKAAYREAIGNAAQHGNADDPAKLITVQYLLDREKVTVVVTDEGPGFDHVRFRVRAQTKDAVSAARERHEEGRGGGLGIMLIEKCADRVEYNDTGNAIILTKFLRAAVPTTAAASS